MKLFCNIRHRGMLGMPRRTGCVFHRSYIQDPGPIANDPAPISIPRDDAAIHLERRPPLSSDELPSCQDPDVVCACPSPIPTCPDIF